MMMEEEKEEMDENEKEKRSRNKGQLHPWAVLEHVIHSFLGRVLSSSVYIDPAEEKRNAGFLRKCDCLFVSVMHVQPRKLRHISPDVSEKC
jgi:hypothetical protein